jgi:hypothetical protein
MSWSKTQVAEGESQEGKTIGIPPVLEMGTARVGVRTYLSTEHLWNARHMSRLCAEREDALAAESFQGIDMQTRSYATASILEAVAYLESYVNEVWQDAADHHPGEDTPPRLGTLTPAVIGRLRELWKSDRLERTLSVLEKYSVAAVFADQSPLGSGAEPYQSVHALIKLRNELMHWKPEIHWGDEERDLEILLKPRIGVNRLFTVGYPWFPHYVLCASCADWAVRRSVEFVDIWRRRMGVQDFHTPTLESWPNP